MKDRFFSSRKNLWLYILIQAIILLGFPWLTLVLPLGPASAILNLFIVTPLSLVGLSFVCGILDGFSLWFLGSEIILFLISIPLFYFSLDLLIYGGIYLLLSIVAMGTGFLFQR